MHVCKGLLFAALFALLLLLIVVSCAVVFSVSP